MIAHSFFLFKVDVGVELDEDFLYTLEVAFY